MICSLKRVQSLFFTLAVFIYLFRKSRSPLLLNQHLKYAAKSLGEAEREQLRYMLMTNVIKLSLNDTVSCLIKFHVFLLLLFLFLFFTFGRRQVGTSGSGYSWRVCRNSSSVRIPGFT